MKKRFLVLFFLAVMASSVFAMGTPQSSYDYETPSAILSFLPFLLIVIIITVVATGRNKGGAVLVLKEFKLNEDEDGFFKIVGRTSGILGWILSLCGFDPTTSLICDKQTIKHEATAIRYGKKTYNIPLAAVSCVSSGIYKPFGFLVFGVIFVIGGIFVAAVANSFGFFISGILIGGIFLVLYWLNKTMQFSIYTGGIKPIVTINLKKSIIEGQNIDEAKYELAANILNKAVLAQK